MIMPAEGSLQRARSFPKTEPICCPGPSTNLLHQFQCVLHQLSSYQPGHLFLMLLAPVASQLKQILHSVPSPYPDADPRRRRCWKTQSLPCRPSCANPREDGRPRGGSQIYHPAHRTDWRRRIGAGYGVAPPDLQPSRYPPHRPLPRLLFPERAARQRLVPGYPLFLNPD